MSRRYALAILIISCIIGVLFVSNIDYTDNIHYEVPKSTVEPTSTIQEDYVEKVNIEKPKVFKYDYEYNGEYQTMQISDAYYSLSDEFKDYINSIANYYSIEPSLIYAVIQIESNFDVKAFRDGCVGLMQINMINMAWLNREANITDLTNSYDNVKGGCYILYHFLEKGYTIEQALVAYNVGHVSTNSSQYSRRVISLASEYRELHRQEKQTNLDTE